MTKSDDLVIWIMNVGRGLSIMIKTPQNYCILYDLGSSDFSPLDFYIEKKIFDSFELFEGKKIAQCIISHPHKDHISDLNDEHTKFIKENSCFITCQNDKSDNKSGHAIEMKRINNPCGSDELIANYKSLYADRKLPLVNIDPDVDSSNFQMGYYYLTSKQVEKLFPENDQEYANSLSIVLFLSYKGHSIIIPGDINPDALKKILNGDCEKRFTDYSSTLSARKNSQWATKTDSQPSLKSIVNSGLQLLVAPHHGLESGYPKCLIDILTENKKDNRPDVIFASEKIHNAPNSGKSAQEYHDGTAAKGITDENGNIRYYLSTINDGFMKIVINQKVNIYTEKKEENLMRLFK